MGCEGGKHLWTARFYRSGALAFWFCQSCGETDREVEDLTVPRGEWALPDGSVLRRLEPGSVEFRGHPLPGLKDSHRFVLEIAGTGETREYAPSFQRSSSTDDCFILTRYRVEKDRLVKYRIHCCYYDDDRSVRIDEPNGNAILSGLVPLE